MRKKLMIYTLLGILFTSIVGTLSHFLYEWSGNNFYIGFVTPVNETTWEHMKMIFFPMFLYCCFENIMLKKHYPSIICANAVAILIGTFSIPAIFYTYTGILGTNHIVLDIATFYISIIIAFTFSRFLTKKKISNVHCRWLEAVVLLILLCFIIFTVYPQDIGIFRVPQNHSG